MGSVAYHASRVGFMAVGYVIAVLVAVFVTEVVMFAPSVLPDDGRWGSIYANLNDLSLYVFGGLFVTAIYAFPGFVIAMVLAALKAWHGWYAFATAGTLNGVLALMLFTSFSSGGLNDFPLPFLLCCMAGGAAGGSAYWFTIGRFLWHRRRIAG